MRTSAGTSARNGGRAVVALVVALVAGAVVAAATGAPGRGAAHVAAGTAASPQRIIAVAPSAAELLFALGLGHRVVGVGEYVAWPPEARRLPRLGGLLDPRLETVA